MNTGHVHPMQEPATALWGLGISDADFETLRAGFEPRDMDDKWRISVTEQDENGIISVSYTRSWTGHEHYVLNVKPRSGGGGGGNNSNGSGMEIEAITWEKNKNGIRISEDMAKKEVVAVTRSILDCDFEALSETDWDQVFHYPLRNGTH